MNLAVEVSVISSREVGIIVTEYLPIVPLVQIVIDERQIVFGNFSSAILPDFLTNPTRPRFATRFRDSPTTLMYSLPALGGFRFRRKFQFITDRVFQVLAASRPYAAG